VLRVKRCTRCGREWSLDHYQPHPAYADGYNNWCRSCYSEYRREYRRSRAEARDRDAARSRCWRERNPERVREYARSDRERERKKRWDREHLEYVRESALKRYRLKAGAVAAARRKAVRLGATAADLTREEWQEILEDFCHECAYCQARDVPLEQEHLTPLSRGGSHAGINVVPACMPCNRRKSRKTLFEFLASVRSC